MGKLLKAIITFKVAYSVFLKFAFFVLQMQLKIITLRDLEKY